MEALEAKVGVDGSAVTTSIDYKLNNTVATLTGTQTLTNKTLTAPIINNPILSGAEEKWNIVASFPTPSSNIDVLTSTAWYYTSNTFMSFSFNIRGNSTTTLNSLLAVGDSITVAVAATQSIGYNVTGLTIDGVSVTPKWQGGAAPTAGSTSAVDLYVYTIVKTAATPTYTVFASQTKFA